MKIKSAFCLSITATLSVVIAQPPGGRDTNSQSPAAGGFGPPNVILAMDSNGDRQLSKQEIDSVATALKRLDKDGNGTLNAKDLGWPPSENFPFPPPPPLAAIDRNSDGTLSAEEIRGATAALARLDRDRNGTLSDAEMRPDFGGGVGGPPGGGTPFTQDGRQPGQGNRQGHGGRGGFGGFGNAPMGERVSPEDLEFKD